MGQPLQRLMFKRACHWGMMQKMTRRIDTEPQNFWRVTHRCVSPIPALSISMFGHVAYRDGRVSRSSLRRASRTTLCHPFHIRSSVLTCHFSILLSGICTITTKEIYRAISWMAEKGSKKTGCALAHLPKFRFKHLRYLLVARVYLVVHCPIRRLALHANIGDEHVP